MTIPEMVEHEWFQKDYVPSCGYECSEKIHLDDVNAAFDSIEVKAQSISKIQNFINGPNYLKSSAGDCPRDKQSKLFKFHKCLQVNFHVTRSRFIGSV